MTAEPFIERDCIVSHDGHDYESGGAYVSPDYAIAYIASDWHVGVGNGLKQSTPHRYDTVTLATWHGATLGTGRVTAVWRTPRSYVSSYAYQVRATINGRHYTGRTAGPGMVWRGRVAACCKRIPCTAR